MDLEYEIKYHQKEESNWWFLGRRNAILKLFSEKDRNSRILDIGCAGGALLLELKELGFKNLTGLDVSENAIAVCKERGLDNVYVMDGANPTFEKNYFDIIISSDSLEHISDDKISLANWHSILKTNGELYVFVPAFMYLWSEHDLVNHHFRRYTAIELKSKMENAGFEVEKYCYWNFLMYFPTTAFRLFQRIKYSFIKNNNPKDHLNDFNPLINKLLIKIIKAENVIFKAFGLPVGVSAFAKAKKIK